MLVLRKRLVVLTFVVIGAVFTSLLPDIAAANQNYTAQQSCGDTNNTCAVR